MPLGAVPANSRLDLGFPSPEVFARGNPCDYTLPHPEAHIQPCYAALGLAARGCGRQPLGAESQPSSRADASGSVLPRGRGEKGFWISHAFAASGDYAGLDRRGAHVRERSP
jgi:hypothetical protein